VEHVGLGLEKLVAQSLRQAESRQTPVLAWSLACGSAVAERTRALGYDDGILRVEVADAGWKSELQSLAPRYLAALNRYSSETVNRIEFVTLESPAASRTTR
jgi:hypothetical protein